jgi:ribosomal protein S18 acetylase RimI-like enzyme
MIRLEVICPANALLFKNVRLRALQDTPSAFSSTYAKESELTDADWVKRAVQWASGQSVGYLAIDAGSACGIASGMIDQDDAAWAHLYSMWVAPDHRRSGIGRMLVDSVLAWARTKNVRTIQLLVTSNNDDAIKFYQHLGFTLTGYIEPYANDPALSNYEMSRPISDDG